MTFRDGIGSSVSVIGCPPSSCMFDSVGSSDIVDSMSSFFLLLFRARRFRQNRKIPICEIASPTIVTEIAIARIFWPPNFGSDVEET